MYQESWAEITERRRVTQESIEKNNRRMGRDLDFRSFVAMLQERFNELSEEQYFKNWAGNLALWGAQ